MKFQIIEDHKNNDINSIEIKKDEKIKVGKKSNVEDGWLNWVYCCTLDGSSEGWTPVQILEIKDEYGIVLEDYSAKELNVIKGDIVNGNKELNGWVWCVKSNTLEEGWLPKEKINSL